MKVVLLARIRPDAGASGLALELRDPSTATTLRRWGGELVLTDGPFGEPAVPVMGLERIDVTGLDEAIRLAARLFTASAGTVEVRRVEENGEQPAGPVGGGRRYVLLHVLPADRTPPIPADDALLDRLVAPPPPCTVLAGTRLLPAGRSTAATVRVRDGELLVEPGPAVGRAEEIAGYDLLHAPNLDEAIAVARSSPTLAAGAIEIRPVVPA